MTENDDKNDRNMKTALITGATSGIGRACATRFAKEGWRVIVTGRNIKKLSELETEIKGLGAEVLSLAFDVRDRDGAISAVRSLTGDWAVIDALINNAGLALGLDKEWEGDMDDWETMIDTNVKGLLTMTRLIVPGMVSRGRGHVVNIGSVAGDAAYAGGSVYCATKSAVKALTDGLRIDLADTAVRVTNVKPGLVETNFSVTRFHGDKARADKTYSGITPLTGDDIADAVWYAVSTPEHVQVAEMLILATHQASASVIHRD